MTLSGETTTRTVVPQAAAETLSTPIPLSAGRRPQGRERWIVLGTMAVLLALVGWRMSFVDGLLRRVTIDGASMAPVLFGPRYAVTCADCGFPFACDAENPPAGGKAVCPNCGYAANDVQKARLLPADRVLVDRWPVAWRAPARGEIVAATLPDPPHEQVVKRVLGLPGERLRIEDGDLWIGSERLRKSPNELEDVRILVHDNDYQPRQTADLPPRWQSASSNWQVSGGGYVHQADAGSGGLDWLAYQHWSCTGHPLRPRAAATPPEDLDGFNQGQTSRPLNRVSDVLLTCRVKLSGEGALAFAATDGDQRLEAILEPGGRLIVRSGGLTLHERSLPAGRFARAADVQFGLCDKQVLLAIEGRTLVQLPYDGVGPAPPSAQAGNLPPLAIGASGLTAELSQLKVWRDIYYLAPSGIGTKWELPTAADPAGVVLLGDNQPISTDSRQWPTARLPLDSLRGRVYRPFWESR